MANKEHLQVLKQGVKAWNRWREKNPGIAPDLCEAFLHGADLSGADLRRADLTGANLISAKLRRASLGGANLTRTELAHGSLTGANLTNALLAGTILRQALLWEATFRHASLLRVNFSGAHLDGANFNDTVILDTDFWDVSMGDTTFSNTDLRGAQRLDSVRHVRPSEISISTIYRSQGRIPEVFLRGCGLPESFIVQIPALVAALQPIQFYSCFISYSSKDEELAQRLYADLQSKGVRCWFAPEDMKIGDRFRRRIDEVIRVHDRLLLLLSEHSVTSSWVEKEVETAMESESEQNRTILFPVRLDDAVMGIRMGWPADVRRSRHIGDFRRWKEYDEYRKAFERLLSDLRAGA
jgi:hypothetical protein